MRRRWRLMVCGALILCSAALVTAGLSLRPGALSGDAFRSAGRSVPPVSPVTLPEGTVDVNSGELYELTELPRVGEVIAGRIIENREAHGPYYYPEDLLSVNGIGAKTLEGFRELLDLTAPE